MNYYKPLFRFFRRPFKRIKLYLKQKAGWLNVPKIIVFRGYGNEEKIFVSGRVIEDSGLVKPDEKLSIWQNILATIKRFSSDELAGVKVRADWNGVSRTMETDEYGFFEFSFKTGIEESDIDDRWHDLQVALIDKVVEQQPEIKAKGQVKIITSQQKRVIVSDIDDTVLVSHSTRTLKKIRLMLFKNAHTRLPFEGVSKFYHALKSGKSGNEDFPFFFVSSSEWNLYDLLDDFFAYQDIPKGLLMLRRLDHSIYKFWKSGGGTHEHKYEKIRHLLQFYPAQKFILIGDSGQRDPEIYKRLALEFPGRVEAIFIRKVRSKIRIDQADFREKLESAGTLYHEIGDPDAAIAYARNEGYIGSGIE